MNYEQWLKSKGHTEIYLFGDHAQIVVAKDSAPIRIINGERFEGMTPKQLWDEGYRQALLDAHKGLLSKVKLFKKRAWKFSFFSKIKRLFRITGN